MSQTLELDFCEKCDYLFPTKESICPACGSKTIRGKYVRRVIVERLAFILTLTLVAFCLVSVLKESYEAASIAAFFVAASIYGLYHAALMFGGNDALVELIKIQENSSLKKTRFSFPRFGFEFISFPLLVISLPFRFLFSFF